MSSLCNPSTRSIRAVALDDEQATINAHSLSVTPFPQLLNSCTIPLSSETAQINAHIDNLAAEISDTERQIANMDNQDDLLSQRLAQLESEVSLHKGMCSRLRHLPVEIVTEFFAHAIGAPNTRQDWYDPTFCYTKIISQTPWIIAAVCMRWRQIMLSTPVLWSNLPITLERAPVSWPHNPERIVSPLQNQLTRSADADLYITIHEALADSGLFSRRHTRLMARLMGVLSSHSHRIRGIYLPMSLFIRLLGHPLPRLSYLSLHLINTTSWPTGDGISQLRIACRGLKSLRLFSHPWDRNLHRGAVFPWGQLVSLYLRCQVRSFLDLLPMMEEISPQIISLDIGINDLDDDEDEDEDAPDEDLVPIQSSKILMSKLESLRLAMCSCALDHQFLKLITAPSLSFLCIVDPADSTCIDAVNDLITRSSCSLSSLRIMFFQASMPPASCVPLLRNLSIRTHLRDLQIDVYNGEILCIDDLLNAMLEDPVLNSESPFLSLKNLTLIGRTTAHLESTNTECADGSYVMVRAD